MGRGEPQNGAAVPTQLFSAEMTLSDVSRTNNGRNESDVHRQSDREDPREVTAHVLASLVFSGRPQSGWPSLLNTLPQQVVLAVAESALSCARTNATEHLAPPRARGIRVTRDAEWKLDMPKSVLIGFRLEPWPRADRLA